MHFQSMLNTAMQSRIQAEACAKWLQDNGLPLHADPPKNWDNALAVQAAAEHVKDGWILDAGAAPGSAFLQGMAKLRPDLMGKLWGCNTDMHGLVNGHQGINYARVDIQNMPLAWTELFDFIACLSVIEHGVDVLSFLDCAQRCLRPGGHLFISTDYWIDPVHTGGQMAFGAPVKVYDQLQIDGIVRVAESCGLRLTGRLDLRCGQRTVQWLGMEYTFINLLLRKED